MMFALLTYVERTYCPAIQLNAELDICLPGYGMTAKY